MAGKVVNKKVYGLYQHHFDLTGSAPKSATTHTHIRYVAFAPSSLISLICSLPVK